MTLPTADLLARLAETLRTDIGPAVDDEYTRTQAFMAAVILERVSRQVELAPAHAEAERHDLAQLFDDLPELVGAAPDEVVAAVDRASAADDLAALTPVVEALYRWGPEPGPAAEALARIRVVLRRDIDRRMEIAR